MLPLTINLPRYQITNIIRGGEDNHPIYFIDKHLIPDGDLNSHKLKLTNGIILLRITEQINCKDSQINDYEIYELENNDDKEKLNLNINILCKIVQRPIHTLFPLFNMNNVTDDDIYNKRGNFSFEKTFREQLDSEPIPAAFLYVKKETFHLNGLRMNSDDSVVRRAFLQNIKNGKKSNPTARKWANGQVEKEVNTEKRNEYFAISRISGQYSIIDNTILHIFIDRMDGGLMPRGKSKLMIVILLTYLFNKLNKSYKICQIVITLYARTEALDHQRLYNAYKKMGFNIVLPKYIFYNEHNENMYLNDGISNSKLFEHYEDLYNLKLLVDSDI